MKKTPNINIEAKEIKTGKNERSKKTESKTISKHYPEPSESEKTAHQTPKNISIKTINQIIQCLKKKNYGLH